MTQLITTKIQPKDLRLLRQIAAETGEKQYEVVNRLLENEKERLDANKYLTRRLYGGYRDYYHDGATDATKGQQ
jgi:hypothetical protein